MPSQTGPRAAPVASTIAVLSLLAASALLAGCTNIVSPNVVVTVTAPQEGVVGPVQGAIVLLSDDIHGGTTDSDGQVKLYGVHAGLYNVSVEWKQQKQVQSLMVGNATVSASFRLNETAKPDIQVVVMQAWRCTPSPDQCALMGRGPDTPAEGATVLLSDNVHGGRTQSDGKYGFFALDRGTYQVTVQFEGQSQTRDAKVTSTQLVLDFTF